MTDWGPRHGSPAAPWQLPGDYQFVSVLGSGAYGTVLLARHVPLGRLVAVKLIPDGALVPRLLERTTREARILARLDHPAIVGVLDLLVVGTDICLVMPYVEGGDLSTALRTGSLDRPALLNVLADCGSGLEAAARAGVVHRDVKPSNILITLDGRGVLADFGLARWMGAASQFRTGSAVGLGTAGFVAPEQLVDPGREDPAADRYSFAAVAFLVATGRSPWADSSGRPTEGGPALDAIPRLRQYAPAVRAATEDLLARGLSLDPACRPAPSVISAALLADVDALPPVVGATAPASSSAAANSVGPGSSRVGLGTMTDSDEVTATEDPHDGRDAARPVVRSEQSSGSPVAGDLVSWVELPEVVPTGLGRRTRGRLARLLATASVGLAVAGMAWAFTMWLRR